MSKDFPAGIGGGWKAQNLIKREDLISFLQQLIKIAPCDLPENTYGSLYVIGGIAQAADEIMDYLEERALELKRLGVYPDGIHHSEG